MEFDNTTKDPLLTSDNSPVMPRALPYFLLFFTICLETFGTLMLKHSLIDNRIYVVAFVCYFLSLSLFSLVLKYIPLSVAYTTWCTFGTVGVCVLSNLIYEEEMRPLKWVCVLLTIPCVVGLYIL